MKQIKFMLDSSFEQTGIPVPPPVPAVSMIPQWYKDAEVFINKETMGLDIPDPSLRIPGIKSCMPVFDSLTSGYFLTTWWSIEITSNKLGVLKWKYVEKDENGEWVDSIVNPSMIMEREGEMAYTLPRPEGFAQNHMVWQGKWGMKLPKGWSLLVMHPSHRFDLPFYTIGGIIDSDRFSSSGNLPWFIKKDWVGIIEKGTPIAQLIPIKREAWISRIISEKQDKMGLFLAHKVRSVVFGYYRSNIWVKKRYEADYDFKKK
jgi:hypothetical protein